MPTSITASNGSSYHLWQLPDRSAPEPVDEKYLTTLENEMGEGYATRQLFGLDTGVRSWKLNIPRMSGAAVRTASLTDPEGNTVSYEQYLRNLWHYNQRTGIPFAIQWPNETNGQYYLVDFADEPLVMKKARNVDIYGTSVTLRQRRINGVTVFDISKHRGLKTGYEWFKGANFSGSTWTASAGSNLAATGDVVKVTAAQNGHDIVRLNNTANTGYLVGGNDIAELFVVMKMREATFSNDAGLLTNATTFGAWTGDSGTTKFAEGGVGSDYEYRLNGVEYAADDRQAPMNEWGVVHIRYPDVWSFSGDAQIGKNGNTAGTYAEVDIGEIVRYPVVTSNEIAREITEYLTVKWGAV